MKDGKKRFYVSPVRNGIKVIKGPKNGIYSDNAILVPNVFLSDNRIFRCNTTINSNGRRLGRIGGFILKVGCQKNRLPSPCACLRS